MNVSNLGCIIDLYMINLCPISFARIVPTSEMNFMINNIYSDHLTVSLGLQRMAIIFR